MVNCRIPTIHQASGCADDVEKDHHLLTQSVSILSADTELGKMQPATAAASTERIMRQKVKIDHGYAENDAKKKKHGHKNISPTVSGFSIGNEDDGRMEEKQNRMSDAVPSAINRSLAQETAKGMLYHHWNPSRLSY